MKQMTKEQIERRYINDLIYRKNEEVVEVMRKIPSFELFGWKFEVEKC